ncbi:membrane protein [Candidatus Francisella endociliophora]|uniref:Membrane protein n=1 Tax=Candidatus Francisella endociliophora TaxID=653937 RepID=A0A097EMR5_9GAMM|nr:hypothetical protein [Francisella sp. FSC1006]AIT08864.1 membrane protein [Francisella sp. FSC1006]
MIFRKKQTEQPDVIKEIQNDFEFLKPKVWKLFNWMIFCSFILVLSSYLNARIFLLALSFACLICLSIKLYLLNKLPPTNFRIYIIVFLIIFVICEYNHLQIVYFRSFKISNIDFHQLISDPGIFVGALCNIVFTTKLQVAPHLFFREEFIQWFANYMNMTQPKALKYLDGIFFVIFGFIIPVIINFIYAMLAGVIAVRIKQLFNKS